MNEEITATMRYDVPTMLGALRWHYRKANRVSLVLGSIASVMVGLAVLLSLNTPNGSGSPWALLMAPLPAILLVALSRWMSRYSFAKSIQSSPSAGRLLTYKIHNDGIIVDLEGAKAEFAWSFFLKSSSTPTGVLLYSQKQAFNWLPKAGFDTEDDYRRFLELIASKTKHSKIG